MRLWFDVQTCPFESAKMPMTCPHFQSDGSTGHDGSGLKVGTPFKAATGFVCASAPTVANATIARAAIARPRVRRGNPKRVMSVQPHADDTTTISRLRLVRHGVVTNARL